MGQPGRPSKFSEGLATRILELAKNGQTDDQIADLVGISVATLNNWKGNKRGFLEALRGCKQLADDLVEASLFQRAVGYRHPAIKISFAEGQILSEEYTEHYPPDTTACIFWLKNRQKEHWRDVHKLEITREQAIEFLEKDLEQSAISEDSESSSEGESSES